MSKTFVEIEERIMQNLERQAKKEKMKSVENLLRKICLFYAPGCNNIADQNKIPNT